VYVVHSLWEDLDINKITIQMIIHFRHYLKELPGVAPEGAIGAQLRGANPIIFSVAARRRSAATP
jgi:hypothetical protein